MARPQQMSEYRRLELAAMEQLPLTVRCSICLWEWTGTTAAARLRASEHRSRAHPEIPPYRRLSRRRLRTFEQFDLNDEEKEEIQRDRQKRAFLAGIEIEE